jgi:hypothetical protein
MGCLRGWVWAVVGRLLYHRAHLWLDSGDGHSRLLPSTSRGGWRIAHVDGARLEFERPRFHRP